MHRRDLLRGAAAAAALSLLPIDAHAAWSRVRMLQREDGVFTPAQRALVAALADGIIPRTNTPGATDVGVPAFVGVIVGENYTATERTAFLAGLDAIDALAQTTGGATFAHLAGAARTTVLDALDKPVDRTVPAARTYARLKGLVVHGYFTSERVQKDVLQTVVMPGRFDGAVPFVAKTGGPSHE